MNVSNLNFNGQIFSDKLEQLEFVSLEESSNPEEDQSDKFCHSALKESRFKANNASKILFDSCVSNLTFDSFLDTPKTVNSCFFSSCQQKSSETRYSFFTKSIENTPAPSLALPPHVKNRISKRLSDEVDEAHSAYHFNKFTSRLEEIKIEELSQSKSYFDKAIECVGHNRISYFKDDERPKILYVTATEDEFGVMDPTPPSAQCDLIRDLDKAGDLVYMTATSVDEVYGRLKKQAKGSISSLVLDVHSSPDTVKFSPEWNGSFTDRAALQSLRNDATIHLWGCAAGFRNQGGVANQLAESIKPNRGIYLTSPKISIGAHNITILDKSRLDMQYHSHPVECILFSPDDSICRRLTRLSNGDLDVTRRQHIGETSIFQKIFDPIALQKIYDVVKLAPLVALNQVMKLPGKVIEGTCWVDSKNPFNVIMPSPVHTVCKHGPDAAQSIGRAIVAVTPNRVALAASSVVNLWNYYGNEMVYNYKHLPEWYVRSAYEGKLDIALIPVGGVVGKTAFSAASGIRKIVLQWKDSREIKVITKLASKSGNGLEKAFFVSEMLQDYSVGTKVESSKNFISHLAHRRTNLLDLQNTRDVLPPIAQGRSSDSVYFVRDQAEKTFYVLKDFSNLSEPTGKFTQEILAYDTLHKLKLKNASLPRLVKLGRYQPQGAGAERGLMAMTNAEGESLAIIIDRIGTLPLTRRMTTQPFAQLSAAMEKVGATLGEIHRKTTSASRVPSSDFVRKEICDFHMFAEAAEYILRNLGFARPLSKAQIKYISFMFERNPGKASLVHGDAHLSNFIWNKKKSRLSAIDPGSITLSLNGKGQPVGVGVRDYAQWHVVLDGYGSKAGLTKSEISALRARFQKGYDKEFTVSASSEVHTFYQFYWNYRRLVHILSRRQPDKELIREILHGIEKLKTKR